MAQAFTGDGELVEADIPSPAILLVAKDKIITNRKTAGQQKKERAQQFVSEAFNMLRDILQATSYHAELSGVTDGDFRELLEATPRSFQF